MFDFDDIVGVAARHGGDSPLSVAVRERQRDTIQMVRDAIANQNVLLAFQPVAQTANLERPAFYEGLIRVLDRSGRIIPAADFISDVETSEIGRQIDCLALELGLQTLADAPDIRLAINMSARSIGYPCWLETLSKGLRADPLIAERLILEITESSAIMMPELVQSFMAELQKKGISFALDDFGAGFTSFRYLRDFYFDILKIDGQFVHGIHESADNQILLQALLSIGQHFEMFTVAEGVETLEDAEFLSDIGIDCMQGYYFGAPTIRPYWTQDQSARRTG